MRDNIPSTGRGNKILPTILITANLLMLVIGILTIPPNLPSAAGKESPVLRAEQTAPSTPALEEQTPPAAMENGSIPAPKKTGVSLSTTERPDLEDFRWYTEDVFYNGVPSNAAVTGLETLTGGWKALIIYDPDNSMDSNAYEFLNIAIAGTADDLTLTLDWYSIFWGGEGESFDETDMEDTVFHGKWENGGLWASGAGTIRLEQFYSLRDKQYAIGTMDTPDGIPAFIALVRP